MENYDETDTGIKLEFNEQFYKMSLIPEEEQKETLEWMYLFLRESGITDTRILRILFSVAHHLPKRLVVKTMERCLLYNCKTPAYFQKALQTELAAYIEDARSYLRWIKKAWQILQNIRSGAEASIMDVTKSKTLKDFFIDASVDISNFSLNDDNAEEILQEVEDKLLYRWKFVGKYAEKYGWNSLLPPEKNLQTE